MLECELAILGSCNAGTTARLIGISNSGAILIQDKNSFEAYVYPGSESFVLDPLMLGDADQNGCLNDSDAQMLTFCREATADPNSPTFSQSMAYCEIFDFDMSGVIDYDDVKKFNGRLNQANYSCE
jgi:hypothetical protein